MITSIRSGLIFIILITILTGCGGLSDKEEQDYYQRAVPIGQKYFQEHYDVEIIFMDYDINLSNSSTMFLYGYVKNDQYISIIRYSIYGNTVS